MSNQSTQSVSTSTKNNQSNKENTMITVESVKALLNKYKEVQQEGVELQSILDSNRALKSQANKNEVAILKRMKEIMTAVEVIESDNESLKKAVAFETREFQAVIDTQKQCRLKNILSLRRPPNMSITLLSVSSVLIFLLRIL